MYDWTLNSLKVANTCIFKRKLSYLFTFTCIIAHVSVYNPFKNNAKTNLIFIITQEEFQFKRYGKYWQKNLKSIINNSFVKYCVAMKTNNTNQCKNSRKSNIYYTLKSGLLI